MTDKRAPFHAGTLPAPDPTAGERAKCWRGECRAACYYPAVCSERPASPPAVAASTGTSEDVEALSEEIASVTDLWDEPLDEVHDIPQITRAVLTSDWLAAREAAARAEERERIAQAIICRARNGGPLTVDGAARIAREAR